MYHETIEEVDLEELEEKFREGDVPMLWIIQARVILKQPLNDWQEVNGEIGGKRLFFSIVDKTGVEAECVAHNQNAWRFDYILKEGEVYYICNANLTKNDYTGRLRLNFNSRTLVASCHDELNEIPRLVDHLRLRDLDFVKTCEQEEMIDVVAVVFEMDPIEEVTCVTRQTPVITRDIWLCDKTKTFVQCRFWDTERANEAGKLKLGQVVMLHDVVVKHIRNKVVLSAGKNSHMVINSKFEEAQELEEWFRVNPEVSSSWTRSSRKAPSPPPVLKFADVDPMLKSGGDVVFQLESCRILELDYLTSYKACKKHRTRVNGDYYCEICIDCVDPVEIIRTKMTVFDGDHMRLVDIFHEKLNYLFPYISPERLLFLEQKKPGLYSQITDGLVNKTFKMTVKASIYKNEPQYRMWNAIQIPTSQ